VLVVGGADDANTALPSAELYDPATGIWTATGSLHTARYLHTATLLSNGQVLVAGGYHDLTSAELYDPVTGTWAVTGGLNTGRQTHTATLLPNGQVLVAGGNGTSGSLDSTELYDPANATWTAARSLNIARSQHAATLLPSGQVLVAGGEDNSNYPFSTELYDPATGSWMIGESLDATRENHTATLLLTGQVLLAGGYQSGFLTSAELYDSATGSTNLTTQTISDFEPIPTQTFGIAPFAITPPTATSGLPVTITVQSGPATISDNVVTITGAGTVVLAADQPGDATFSAAPEVTTSFTVTPPNLSFAQWAAKNSLGGGATDTPQHDAVSNLIKYLLDINPSQPMTDADKAALPAVGTTTIAGTKYLTLTYRASKTTSGLVINVQISTDLQNWNAPSSSQTIQIRTDTSTGDPIMQVQVPVSGPMMFIRLNLNAS
jgi:N-acetylneuraminic acid mutarotase